MRRMMALKIFCAPLRSLNRSGYQLMNGWTWLSLRDYLNVNTKRTTFIHQRWRSLFQDAATSFSKIVSVILTIRPEGKSLSNFFAFHQQIFKSNLRHFEEKKNETRNKVSLKNNNNLQTLFHREQRAGRGGEDWGVNRNWSTLSDEIDCNFIKKQLVYT